MPKPQDINDFLSRASDHAIIDVRTPREFEQGHIPGAINVPLFNNEERAVIGTLYKQQSRQAAVEKGMELVGPRMKELVKEITPHSKNDSVFVHCWRGGMRSGFVATLMEMYGLKSFTLKGGYKSFRRFVLKSFEQPRQFMVLGGKTGSGKTVILKKIEETGMRVLDLEGIAHHKGSSFGSLGEKEQPTQEQFENEISTQLFFSGDTESIWVEDESRMIGKKVIPGALWDQMRAAPIYYIELPIEERLKYIVSDYGKFSVDHLEAAISRISKRLGPEQSKNAIAALRANDLYTCFEYCLKYYDKSYLHGLQKRENPVIRKIAFEKFDAQQMTESILKTLRSFE